MPEMTKRRMTAFVEEGILSVEFANPNHQSDVTGRPTILGRIDVEMDEGHALIVDGLVKNDLEYGVEGDSINGLLREAVKLGMRLQAKAANTAVIPPDQLVPLQ